jgi:hypothetical protein
MWKQGPRKLWPDGTKGNKLDFGLFLQVPERGNSALKRGFQVVKILKIFHGLQT